MKHWIEGALFAVLAVAAHVALFASFPEQGSESGGAGGEYVVSIAGAAPTVRQMVERWEQPPEAPAVQQEVLDTPDSTTPVSPELPQVDQSPAPRAEVRLAMTQPEERATPEIDTETAPPPPEPEPEPEPEKVPETAQQAQTTSAGRAEQRAAGSGGGAQAGAASTASTTTATKGQQARLQQVWGAKIRSRIERRKRYPSGARGDGAVVVRLTISRDGQLLNSQVVRSSGVAVFDQAALRAIASARRFPKAPRGLPGTQFPFSLKISFSR